MNTSDFASDIRLLFVFKIHSVSSFCDAFIQCYMCCMMYDVKFFLLNFLLQCPSDNSIYKFNNNYDHSVTQH